MEKSSFSYEDEFSRKEEVSGHESVITDLLRMLEFLVGDEIVDVLKGEVDLSIEKKNLNYVFLL